MLPSSGLPPYDVMHTLPGMSAYFRRSPEAQERFTAGVGFVVMRRDLIQDELWVGFADVREATMSQVRVSVPDLADALQDVNRKTKSDGLTFKAGQHPVLGSYL